MKYWEPRDLKIKQMMPLPGGTTLMLEVSDDEDNSHWCDYRRTPNAICLASVEYYNPNGELINRIIPYNLTEQEPLFDNSTVVNLKVCPKCGNVMNVHMPTVETWDIFYTCSCGAREATCGEEEQNADHNV